MSDPKKIDPLVQSLRDIIFDACVRHGHGGVTGGNIAVTSVAKIAPVLEAAIKLREQFLTGKNIYILGLQEAVSEFDAAVVKLKREAY
jgi:hypothetical protein